MKPGWKTSEFWLSLLGQLIPVLLTAFANLDPAVAASLVTASGAIYAGQRGYVKGRVQNVPTVTISGSGSSGVISPWGGPFDTSTSPGAK